jgi:hypothetical protein
MEAEGDWWGALGSLAVAVVDVSVGVCVLANNDVIWLDSGLFN